MAANTLTPNISLQPSIPPSSSSEPLAQRIPTDPRDLAQQIAEKASSLPLTNQEKILFAATLLNGAVSLLAASGWTSEQMAVFLTSTTDHLFGFCQWGFILSQANLETAKALLFSGIAETVGRFYPSLRLLLQTGSVYKIAHRAFQGIKSSWTQHQTQGWKGWISSGVRIFNALCSLSSMHKTVQNLFSEKLKPCLAEQPLTCSIEEEPAQCTLSEKPIWKITEEHFIKAMQAEYGEEVRLELIESPFEDWFLTFQTNFWRVLIHATQAQNADSYEKWVETIPEICRDEYTPQFFQALQETPLSAENLELRGHALKHPLLHILYDQAQRCQRATINYEIGNTPLILHGYLRSLYEKFPLEKLEGHIRKYEKASLKQLKEPLQATLLQIHELKKKPISWEDHLQNIAQQEILKEALFELLAILYSPSFSALSRDFVITKEELQRLSETAYSPKELIHPDDEINGQYVLLIRHLITKRLKIFLTNHSNLNKSMYNYFLAALPIFIERFVETQLSLSSEELCTIKNKYKESELEKLQRPFQNLLFQWSSISESPTSQISSDFLKELLAIASCPSFAALRYIDNPIPFQLLQDIEETIYQENQITIRHQIWIAQIFSNLSHSFHQRLLTNSGINAGNALVEQA